MGTSISTKFPALSGHHLMVQSNWNNSKNTKKLQWGSKHYSTHNESLQVDQKNNKKFVFALASKERSDQKNKGILYH